jgi:hypothetical protein
MYTKRKVTTLSRPFSKGWMSLDRSIAPFPIGNK